MKKFFLILFTIAVSTISIEGKEPQQINAHKKKRKKNQTSFYSNKKTPKKSSRHSKIQNQANSINDEVPSFSISEIGVCSILIPSTWQQFTDKSLLPKTLCALYIEPGNQNGLAPTLSIAIENTSFSMKNYVQQAMQYHKKQSSTRFCRIEGSLTTSDFTFEIIHLEQYSDIGAVALLQAITVIDDQAYVINGSCSQERFDQLANIFLQSISSFKIKSYKTLLQKNFNH
ncbi:hypothetical protein [Candidatus Clavichlamydia salmonicola]|uniref:hypothetical protein n=1 Tax=Candidatus Clavichlamydia salmonicola TaxID=469812 RepID=UPI0018917BDE|nr:hypothetical protein [Candidatus Clavichlamydia salmonicola]